MKKQESKRLYSQTSFREQWPMICLLVPFLIVFCLLTLLPIIGSIFLGFTSYDMLSLPKLTGIENFRRMLLGDNVFWITVKNTLMFSVIAGPIGFFLSFLLAWFVNEFSPKVRTLLSFMFFAPSLVGNAYFIWKVIFSGDSYGYINSLLLSIGVISQPVVWLKEPSYIMPIIIIVYLWQSMGISFLANISGLQNVNRDLYEAGSIDGIRSRWQELRYITLPSMQNMLLFSAVMQIQSSFSAGTIASEMAGYPSVRYAADTIVSYMTDVGTIRYEMGYASAIAIFLFLLMAATRIIIGKALTLASK